MVLTGTKLCGNEFGCSLDVRQGESWISADPSSVWARMAEWLKSQEPHCQSERILGHDANLLLD